MKKKHKEERRSPYCTKHFVLWSTTSHASILKVGGKEMFYRLSLEKHKKKSRSQLRVEPRRKMKQESSH